MQNFYAENLGHSSLLDYNALIFSVVKYLDKNGLYYFEMENPWIAIKRKKNPLRI